MKAFSKSFYFFHSCHSLCKDTHTHFYSKFFTYLCPGHIWACTTDKLTWVIVIALSCLCITAGLSPKISLQKKKGLHSKPIMGNGFHTEKYELKQKTVYSPPPHTYSLKLSLAHWLWTEQGCQITLTKSPYAVLWTTHFNKNRLSNTLHKNSICTYFVSHKLFKLFQENKKQMWKKHCVSGLISSCLILYANLTINCCVVLNILFYYLI